jgi:light-regulated signal transduction histidine kinase (bacteriophytochrome)
MTSAARSGEADTSNDPLGNIAQWPQSLRTAMDMCLNSPVASALVSRPAYTSFYNEQYQALCGGPAISPSLRPLLEQALAGHPACIDSPMDEKLLSFAFTPVRDALETVCGVYITVVDATPQIELNRIKEDRDALHYALSHDLRSPLRTMAEMARLLLEAPPSNLPPEMDAFLKQVLRGAQKLDERAAGLLTFNEVSCRPLQRGRVQMSPLVGEILTALGDEDKSRRVDLVVNELPDVMGDLQRIRQLCSITLSNAFKFTRRTEPARIEIGARPEASHVAFFVADNGAGFDMKYSRKLFGLFQRMHSESEFEGVGINLALARRIVERHGGKIWAEGRIGQGAKFSFTLPAASSGVTDGCRRRF